MSERERIGSLTHDFLERRFGGELVDPAQFAREKGDPAGLLAALKEAHQVHQTYLGRTIRDHELLGVIGRGGFGEVYAAKNTALKLDTPCALKVVSRNQFTELSGIKEFKAKIKDLSRLVQVIEVGEAGKNYFWYTMPRADNMSKIQGKYLAKSLDNLLVKSVEPSATASDSRSRGLPVEEVYVIGLAIATALDHLHKVGLVHRDVKPGNILCLGGRWHLGDVGLLVSARDSLALSGTQRYWPPEGPQKDRKKADLYALGLTLYEAVTGNRDVRAAPEEFRSRAIGSLGTTLQPLWKILVRACAVSPEDRFASAAEFFSELRREQRTLEAPPPPEKRRGWFRRLLSRKKV